MAEWKKLNKRSIPPVDNHRSFLLCRGYKDKADQIMNTAKRVENDGYPYIRYIGHIGAGEFGWRILPESEYRDCLWQEIEYP